MKSVKEVLKQDKLPKDYPPTMLDVKTREKHVPQSVDYNIKHFHDHGENICEQLKKLEATSPELAKRYAKKSIEAVKLVLKDLETHL